MAEEIRFSGFDDAKKALKDMGDKNAKKIGRKAVTAGGNVMVPAMKSLAPVLLGTKRNRVPGALRDAIKVRAASKRGSIIAKVGVGKKWFKGDLFYGGFVEFGHKIGKRATGFSKYWRAKKNAARKDVPGVHFIERGYQQTKTKAVEVVMQTLKALATKQP